MIILYNPLSTTPGKQPLPLSVLSLAAILEGRETWTLVDGNVVTDPATAIVEHLRSTPTSEPALLAVTVMPGPQLTQAVAVCRHVREARPDVPIVWGGYFPTQHSDTVLKSSLVDFVVRSQGEQPLLELIAVLRGSLRGSAGLQACGSFRGSAGFQACDETPHHERSLQACGSFRGSAGLQACDETPHHERSSARLQACLDEALATVSSLSWKTADGRIVHNPVGPMTPVDDLPDLPYGRVTMDDYIHQTYLGQRTVAHSSSFGCPFSCSFCAVVAMSNRRWLAQSPARIERVVRHLVERFRIDSMQMHDMDFFISEARTAEFADRIAPLGIGWWGLGRIDTLMQYSDSTWRKMARSGLRMVFSGAESASDVVLANMNKGGKASARLAIELAMRMREHRVVPEYSFVLGSPPDPLGDMAQTFEYIRQIKRVNPATEVILYTYTPVPMDSALFADAARLGFAFPSTLDEWASDRWRQMMLRRGDGIPWMDGAIRRRVRNFERVLNAYYPTVTDRRLTRARRLLLRAASAWRYSLKMYTAPYELRALHRLISYQRPETTGF